MTSYLVLGITFAIIAGIMNGIFTLPMRYMGRWSWENVWALFILVCCVIMPDRDRMDYSSTFCRSHRAGAPSCSYGGRLS